MDKVYRSQLSLQFEFLYKKCKKINRLCEAIFALIQSEDFDSLPYSRQLSLHKNFYAASAYHSRLSYELMRLNRLYEVDYVCESI